MARPPRPRSEPLLSAGLAWHVIFVSALFLAGVFGMFAYGVNRGYPIEVSRTLAVNTLVALEIFHLFFIRNIHGTSLTWTLVRGTPMVWLTVGAVTLAQFGLTYVPALQAVFDTQAVRFVDGLLIVGLGVTLLVVLELEKQLRLIVRRSR